MIGLNLKHRLGNSKGFTLIELVLSLSLISLTLLTVFNLIHFTARASNSINSRDKVLTNGRYGIEYIANEIKRADKIIDSSKIRGFNKDYPNNLGFVIYNFYKGNAKEADRYEFTSYYINSKVLRRVKCSSDSGDYENIRIFIPGKIGDNFLCEYVVDVSKTEINFQKEIINLNILVGDEEYSYEFNTKLHISCFMDFLD